MVAGRTAWRFNPVRHAETPTEAKYLHHRISSQLDSGIPFNEESPAHLNNNCKYPSETNMEVDYSSENGLAGFLPTDILLDVMSYISSSPDSQATLASCCLVCRQWYSAAIEYLYHTPRLTGGKFNAFARSICPDFRSRSRRSDLGQLVHRFNMNMLVHESSNSLTARLLGRMKENLELYRAPMASFTYAYSPSLPCYS